MVNNNILIIYASNIFVFKSQQRQLVVSTLNPSWVQAQEKTMKTLKVDHCIIVIFFVLVGACWPHLVLLCLNLNQENLNLTRLVRHPLSSSNSSTSERGASCPAAPRNTVNVFNYQKAHSANVPRLTVPLHTLSLICLDMEAECSYWAKCKRLTTLWSAVICLVSPLKKVTLTVSPSADTSFLVPLGKVIRRSPPARTFSIWKDHDQVLSTVYLSITPNKLSDKMVLIWGCSDTATICSIHLLHFF